MKTFSSRFGTLRGRMHGLANALDTEDASTGAYFATTSGTGTSSWSGGPSFFESAGAALEKLVGAKQIYDINQINLERAKTGLPLLTASQINALSPRVNVGIASDTQNTALIIAGVLAAALILPRLLK